MKLHRDCISCLARIADQVAREFEKDAPSTGEMMRRVKAALEEAFRPDKCPPWLATIGIHEISALTGESDPYASIRQKEMAAAQQIFRRIRPRYGDDFRSSIELAVLGNNLDFFRSIGDLETALAREWTGRLDFSIDHIDRTEEKLSGLNRGSVVFLADNAGEVFFDIPLLNKVGAMGVRALYGVKERPFLNDLTWADLERAGMLSQIPCTMSTGIGALLDLSSLATAFREEMENCDLIISKGQANYECLSELSPEKDIFYLLKAKCQPIRETLNVPLNSYVALLSEVPGR